jgi:hypothetical protein
MDQETLAPPAGTDAGEPRRDRSEPPGPAVLAGWRCISRATIRAYGQEGYVDLVALHPSRGVALVAFLREGEEASPDEACEAFRVMLRDAGIDKRFPGVLPVVASLVPSASAGHLEELIERAFGVEPAPTAPPGWVEWIAELLGPTRPKDTAPVPLRLVAPAPNEAAPEMPSAAVLLRAPSRTEPLPPTSGAPLAAPAEAPARSMSVNRGRWLDWGASLGLATLIVLMLLAVLALFSHSGRLY